VEHRDICEFAVETGVRIGELTALKLKDINLKLGLCTVQRTWTSCVLRETTKGGHKDPIPLSERALEIVKKNMLTRLAEGMVDISVYDEFLFINPVTGRGYRPEFVRRVWRKLGKSPVKFHEGTRHSFCTQIVETGADVFSAQQLMRHTLTST
jgi:integrase